MIHEKFGEDARNKDGFFDLTIEEATNTLSKRFKEWKQYAKLHSPNAEIREEYSISHAVSFAWS